MYRLGESDYTPERKFKKFNIDVKDYVQYEFVPLLCIRKYAFFNHRILSLLSVNVKEVKSSLCLTD
jgi:hypothetical protein